MDGSIRLGVVPFTRANGRIARWRERRDGRIGVLPHGSVRGSHVRYANEECSKTRGLEKKMHWRNVRPSSFYDMIAVCSMYLGQEVASMRSPLSGVPPQKRAFGGDEAVGTAVTHCDFARVIRT